MAAMKNSSFYQGETSGENNLKKQEGVTADFITHKTNKHTELTLPLCLC